MYRITRHQIVLYMYFLLEHFCSVREQSTQEKIDRRLFIPRVYSESSLTSQFSVLLLTVFLRIIFPERYRYSLRQKLGFLKSTKLPCLCLSIIPKLMQIEELSGDRKQYILCVYVDFQMIYLTIQPQHLLGITELFICAWCFLLYCYKDKIKCIAGSQTSVLWVSLTCGSYHGPWIM